MMPPSIMTSSLNQDRCVETNTCRADMFAPPTSQNLAITVFKGSLINNRLFKLEIGPAFVKKVSGAKKIPGNIRSWVFAKAVTRVIKQDALER